MALDIYASDQEKGEAIRQWWRENVLAVVAGIVIGLLLLFGVRSWLEHRQDRVKEASALYQQILAAKAQKADVETSNAERLIQDYSNTPYGVFGALMLAKEEQQQGDLEAAIEHLEWALEHSPNRGLQRIVYLRLAHLWLARGNAEEALASLDKVEPGSFSSAYAELRGDAQVVLGQLAAARQAYQEALRDVESEQRQRILRMKLESVTQS
jgi:predicted negative regulator of RcsB-dependent stress response